MGEPETDTAGLMLELLNTAWDTDTVEKPDVFRLKTEDEQGRPKKQVQPQADEYLLFSEIDERNEDYADLPRNSVSLDYACFAEFATVIGRDRREEVFQEIRRIARANNRRLDAETLLGQSLGGWDRLNYNATVPDEDLFDYWVIEWTFTLDKSSHTI
jgi:hypothetical protein